MTALDASLAVARNPEILAAEVDGEMMMINPELGRYYQITGTGMAIWALLERPCTVAEIRARIVAEYAVSEEVARADIDAFLTEALAADAVRRA